MSEDRVDYRALSAEEICSRLSAWAEAARATTPGAGIGAVAVTKSDLLGRLIQGGEKAPSQTPCPVHNGRWSGCDTGWPGSSVVRVDFETGASMEEPAEVDPRLQEWWDAGCRCATHRGSRCTTGWNPDEACGCVDGPSASALA